MVVFGKLTPSWSLVPLLKENSVLWLGSPKMAIATTVAKGFSN